MTQKLRAYLIIEVRHISSGPKGWAWDIVSGGVSTDAVRGGLGLGAGELKLCRVVDAETGEVIYEAPKTIV